MCCFFCLILIGVKPRLNKAFSDCDREICEKYGSGVIEIAIKYDNKAYRCIQAVQLGKNIYVLHAFVKKSKKGIKTPKQDIDLIKKRYQQALELAKND